ncbi:MAG: ClbS/DfsB family four-helix bundle protein [Anaerolineae bacterium]|nr:ClbS/DfsB family four-helix bundle protein [Anaerolineae bacterium]
MRKLGLLNWLREQQQEWKALLDQIDPARMDQPGVAGHWSMKDIVAHLTGWNHHLAARLQAAQRSEPEPPPPWSGHAQTQDEINAWIYESNRGRSAREVLDESDQVFQQLVAVIESLPDEVPIDTVRVESGREFYLVWIGGERFLAGEFFDHFHDDHEADIRAWLARGENP